MDRIKWNKDTKSFSISTKEFSSDTWIIFYAGKTLNGHKITGRKFIRAESLSKATDIVKNDLLQDIEAIKRLPSHKLKDDYLIELDNVTGWGKYHEVPKGKPPVEANDYQKYSNKYLK